MFTPMGFVVSNPAVHGIVLTDPTTINYQEVGGDFSTTYGLMSFWLKIASLGSTQIILDNYWDDGETLDDTFRITISASGILTIEAWSIASPAVRKVNIISNTALTASAWNHVIASYNTTSGAKELYIDGSSNLSGSSSVASDSTAVGFQVTGAYYTRVFAQTASVQDVNLADFWWYTAGAATASSYVSSFRTAANKPKWLGANGSAVGLTPRLFYHTDVNQNANYFLTNRGSSGSAGNLTVASGSISKSSAHPSD